MGREEVAFRNVETTQNNLESTLARSTNPHMTYHPWKSTNHKVNEIERHLLTAESKEI
jgi:hypothetical protein